MQICNGTVVACISLICNVFLHKARHEIYYLNSGMFYRLENVLNRSLTPYTGRVCRNILS